MSRPVCLTGFLLLVAAGCTTLCAATPAASPTTSADQRVPVLVELFTSEGCSDCPPADSLLAQLDSRQPIPHAHAIVLSEHVTYWNHDGWRDRFSLDEIDQRQKDYVFRFGLQDSYTPQMVVDGTTQFVGNDPQKLELAVKNAAATPKQPLSIENAHWEKGAVDFSVHGVDSSNDRLVAALAVDSTSDKVSAGENEGRTLSNVAVVRVIKNFGAKAADGSPLHLGGSDLDDKNEAKTPVRLVVFQVDHKTGHVVAVAEQTLQR
ncbi:MAG TPA: DUF1223 domain-containing protein [Terracidiphilus sp.]|nr:DUF1223 domain-containing protein [Terracidiphilus sp.]